MIVEITVRYLLAILLPPVAVLGCGKPFQFILNLIFWLLSVALLLLCIPVFFFAPVLLPASILIFAFCALHAVVARYTHSSKQQMDRLVSAIESRTNTAAKA